MDLYSFLNEIIITLFKHGWSLTTWGILGALFFRLNSVRRMVLRRVPKRFRAEDRLDRVERKQEIMDRKLDAIMAQMGVQAWQEVGASKILTNGPTSLKRSSRLSQVVRFINPRRIKLMQKLKSRKFILALATGILIVLNDGLDMGLDTQTIMYVVGIVATWILGESAVDTVRAKKEASNERTFTTPTEPTE